MNILADYLSRSMLAEQLGVCERSIARYEALPNGLPATVIGGRKLYKLASVQAWLAARERRPNPRRMAVAS